MLLLHTELSGTMTELLPGFFDTLHLVCLIPSMRYPAFLQSWLKTDDDVSQYSWQYLT